MSEDLAFIRGGAGWGPRHLLWLVLVVLLTQVLVQSVREYTNQSWHLNAWLALTALVVWLLHEIRTARNPIGEGGRRRRKARKTASLDIHSEQVRLHWNQDAGLPQVVAQQGSEVHLHPARPIIQLRPPGSFVYELYADPRELAAARPLLRVMDLESPA